MAKIAYEDGGTKAEITIDQEGLNIFEVKDSLIRPVLLAAGFHEETIKLILEE